MIHSETKKPLLLLFVGEILTALATLSFLGSILNFLGYVSFIAIIGFVISLIGILRLRNACKPFRDVCYGILIALLFYLAASIIACIPAENNSTKEILLFIIMVLLVLGKAMQFYNVLRTIEGCNMITKSEENAQLGKLSIKLFVIGLILTCVCVLLTGIFFFAIIEGTASGLGIQICSILASVLSFTSEVLYLIYLYKNYKLVD